MRHSRGAGHAHQAGAWADIGPLEPQVIVKFQETVLARVVCRDRAASPRTGLSTTDPEQSIIPRWLPAVAVAEAYIVAFPFPEGVEYRWPNATDTDSDADGRGFNTRPSQLNPSGHIGPYSAAEVWGRVY